MIISITDAMDGILQITSASSVYVGSAAKLLGSLLPEGRVIVISDTNIDRCHHALLAPYDHILIGLGEQSKTFATLDMVYRRLIELGADRHTFILGIGGGIVTDITGFVASTYMRGVRFGFVTTTLLGAADASVGGKNGVNVGGFKNMVGLFSQPEFVVCDVSLFKSLPDREFRAGLAEIIKAAIIDDAALFARLEGCSFEVLRADEALLAEVLSAAVQVKARIVAQDERESGLRRVLNLGHTLAHAIEKCSSKMNHGEAVAVGLQCMTDVACREGVLDSVAAARIEALLHRYGFDVSLPIEMRKLCTALRGDKKRDGDSIHVVLPAGVGSVVQQKMTFENLEKLLNYDKGTTI